MKYVWAHKWQNQSRSQQEYIISSQSSYSASSFRIYLPFNQNESASKSTFSKLPRDVLVERQI